MGLTREKEIEVLLDAGSAGRDLMSHIDSRCPDVWVLIPKRAGDTTQVLALAEALDWPFEVKTFARRKGGLLLAPPFMASLAGIRRSGSSELKGPWPDLVITAGAENEPIARWIRMQSGGRTRIVIVGRAWADASDYDLVVTTPQYRMPRLPNVLHNGLPLHRVTTDRLKRDAALWAPRLANLPRPFITVLVGGTSGPYPFTVESGERLARQASALAKRLGGSLLITTSSRTPKAAVDAMAAAIDVPHVLHSWRQNDPENPYFAFLELGDEIIVTADSVSMMGEACATVKPVHLFDLGEDWTSMRVSLGLAGEPPRARAGRPGPPRGWQECRIVPLGHAEPAQLDHARFAPGPPRADRQWPGRLARRPASSPSGCNGRCGVRRGDRARTAAYRPYLAQSCSACRQAGRALDAPDRHRRRSRSRGLMPLL